MTNPSDKYPDGSPDIADIADTAQEHKPADTADETTAHDANTTAPSVLPPYMVSPDTLPATLPPPEQEQPQKQEDQREGSAFVSLGESLAAAQPKEEPGPAISVAPDGTAVLQEEKNTHPVLHVEQAMPASILSRIYILPAAVPFIFLTLMLLVQVFLSLPARELWIGAEVRIAGLFQGFLSGNSILLELNGETYTDLPPLYFWFLYGLYLLIGSQGPALFFLAAGLSVLLYLWAALGLGRLVGRVDGRTNLAAGIILLSTACILGVTHSAGLDLMFAALILASCIILYRAYVSPQSAPVSMILAFALAAAATLVNGPLGILMPVCAITLFALWRGDANRLHAIVMALAAVAFGFLPGLAGLPLLRFFGLLPGAQALPLTYALILLALPMFILLLVLALAPRLRAAAGIAFILMAGAFVLSGGTSYLHWPLGYVLPLCLLAVPVLLQATPQRLFRPDFFIGLGAGLTLAGAWLVAVYWLHGDLDFIVHTLLKGQLLERGLGNSVDSAAWSFYLLRLPLILLPWTILLIFLPWGRLFGKHMRDGLTASRTPAGEGLAFLWSLIISSLLLLSVLGDKHPHHLLPALPALAILAAHALMGIEGKRAVYFRYAIAFLLFIGGFLALFGTLMLFGALPRPDFVGIPWTLPTSGGFFAVSVILLLSGAILWLVLGSSRPEGVLLIMALSATLVGYSIGNLSAPALDPVLSPKQQALMLRAYLDKGYAVASYNVEPGTYVYYAGKLVPALKDLEAARVLVEQGNVALAMPLADAQSWTQSWPGKPEELREAHRQWLGAQVYVVLAYPFIEGLAPAQAPFGESFDIVEKTKTLLRGFGIPAPEARQAVQPVAPKPGPAPETPTPEAIPQEEPAVPPIQKDAQPAPDAYEKTPDVEQQEEQQNEHQPEDSACPVEGKGITT